MNIFGSKRMETSYCVAIVNSYAVTVAMVRRFHHDDGIEQPVVTYSTTEKIPTAEGQFYEPQVFHHLAIALEKCRSHHGSIDQIFCVVGEPWVTGISRTVHIEKPDSFTVSNELIDDIKRRDLKLAEVDIMRDFAESGTLAIIDTTQTIVDLNGYRSNNPDGQSAKMIDAHYRISFAATEFIDRLFTVFADVFHREDIIMASMESIYAQVMNGQGTLLSIGGATSSLVVYDRGLAIRDVTISAGLHDIERTVAQLFSVPQKLVGSAMRFASDENFNEFHRDVYYERINLAAQHFVTMVRWGIAELEKHIQPIPGPLVVMADPSWAGVMNPLLETISNLPVVSTDTVFQKQHVVYSHDAKVRTTVLSLAILKFCSN